MRRGKENEPIENGKMVNLKLASGQIFSNILTSARYQRVIREAFENGDEIISGSQIDKIQKRQRINIEDFDAEVIGSFVHWEQRYPNGHQTVYITCVTLPTGDKCYPILTEEGVRRGGVDPDLLVAKKY